MSPLHRLPWVSREWTPLREVIVGRPHYRIAAALPPEGRSRVPPRVWNLAKAAQGKSLQEAMPATWARCRLQMDGAVRLLRDRGILVHRVPPFRPAEEVAPGPGLSEAGLFFPRDLALAVGSRWMELTPADPRRRRERHPLRRALRRSAGGRRSRVATMPEPDPPARRDDACPILDGGDCLLAGSDLFVGRSPGGTNDAGIEWLRSQVGSRVAVHPVPYDPDFPHLDCALCLLRPGLGILCPDALPAGPPPQLARWRWIEVDREEALGAMAANGLPLDAGTVLLPEAAERTATALRRAGHRVLSTPFDAVTAFGGGPRCWSQPLRRGG